MKKMKILFGLLLGLGLLVTPVMAGDFDGSKAVICAAQDVLECLPGGECKRVQTDEIDFPDFLKLDFKAKLIRARQLGRKDLKTDIEKMERVDGKLFLQGAEDGREGTKDGLGWTMAIDEESGKLVFSASGTEVAFVIFGACMLP
ncbi:MAG: hypothetical protein QNI89_15360 [Desulfobacterales bacterium]|nr:hypothetical protein [Desulfobacterales bacterium]MDJ0857088.1 hypothetical protein [Desulfobacterales bacterium]MDJ0888684.1 hypothetical protein [Desulfobacterales bacterium]